MKLTQKNVQNNVNANTYQRGVKYFQENRVKIIETREREDGRGVKLQSAAQGSNNNEYVQTITIHKSKSNSIEIDGRCTCPVRFNCKHIVAACLNYIEASAEKEKSVVNDPLNWIDEFATVSNKEELTEDSQEFLCYLLNQGEEPNVLTVRFMSARQLKKGGISKPKAVPVHNLLSKFTRPKYTTQADSDIAQIINSIKGQQWLDYPLQGEIGYLALTKMLATHRCFWKDVTSGPIQNGERREVEFRWEKQKNGDMRLSIEVIPEAIILETSPSLYFEENKNEIGPLKGAAFTPQQWRLLSQMPAIPLTDVAEFSRKLISTLPGIQLPPPVPVETFNIKTPPNPVIHLMSKKVDSGRQHQVLRLQYEYGKHLIPPLPRKDRHTTTLNKKLLIIHRDLEKEAAFENMLSESGFEARQFLDDNELNFAPKKSMRAMEIAEHWRVFVEETAAALKADGCKVIVDNSFDLEFVRVEEWQVDVEEKNEWFDLRFDLEIGGHKIPLLPLVIKVLESYDIENLPKTLTVPLRENKFISLPSERIKPICQILYELHDKSSLNKNGSMRLNLFDAGRLDDLENGLGTAIEWQGGESLRELGKKLKNFHGIETAPIPKGLLTELRDYQQQGLNWLQFLREYSLNGILADDMGLGKTIQALANLLLEKEQGRLTQPCLIIAPTSLMSNWRREAEKFTPELKVLVLQGANRHERFSEINKHDLIITTYPLLVRDHEVLLAHRYHYLVLDEAQNIKNNNSKTSRQTREVKANHRLCLTGTPMENHLGELWSQFDFLMPGLLGNSQFFKRHFRTPIERHNDLAKQKHLSKRISPFMLRRTKIEVITELPPKTEIIRSVTLGGKQAALYESIRLSMEAKVRKAIAQKGLARSHIMVLDALLKLRQTCCDPRLLSIPQAQDIHESAKLEMLMEMLPELIEEGRKILLFSQFTKMLAIIEEELIKTKIRYTKLTGQTRHREEAIDKFKNDEADVFLISLKAGGVGLNLTEADTVIHYDPWWNPASENQATDRAHRIGQSKAVFVYKLITENTVEEKIIALQAKKQALADGVYQDKERSDNMNITANDLESLFAPLVP